jgi:hypothetical protein
MNFEVPSQTGTHIGREYANTLDFINDIDSSIDSCDKVKIDYSDIQWSWVAQTAPLACYMNQLENDGIEVEVEWPKRSVVRRWLRAICFPDGTDTPTPRSSGVPLCRIDGGSAVDRFDGMGDEIMQMIESELKISADALFYAVGELLANINQHASCSHGLFMIQNYPEQDYVDFCMTDDGVTIPGRFERGDVDFTDDSDAVAKAVDQGVSTEGVTRGDGLGFARRLITEGFDGDLVVSSRDGLIMRGSVESQETRYWPGTTILARVFEQDQPVDWIDYAV